MSNPRRALLVPVVIALVVTACGSDSDTDTGATSSSAAAATTAAAPATTAAPGTAPLTQPPPATTPAPVATDRPVSGDTVEIIVNVDDPAEVGQTFDVGLGQTVNLRLLSDSDQEYHVHGYDIETKTAAGVEASIEFVADTAGEFEVESHTTDAVLVVIRVA